MDNLEVMEVDAEGRIVASIIFDSDDRRSAGAEMFERYARSDAARSIPSAAFEGIRAMSDHDLERLRAVVPDDCVFHDHRRTGVGRLEGAAAFTASLAALFEQAPDLTIETLYTVATETHGELVMAHIFGTLAGGGEFEIVYARLMLYRGGRIVAMELFEPEDLDRARARLEELRPDPTRILPNAAARANQRSAEFIVTRDWPAYRELISADFTFDDRRKLMLVSGDVELWIRNLEVVTSWQIVRRTFEPVGTVGDRVVLDRFSFAGDDDGSTFEGEFLKLTEVDADGRLRAVIHFDPEDRRAAFAEAQARFVAGEAAATGGQAPIAALIRALGRHDWEALRACLADDAVIHDRRALGIMGEIDRDQWVESLRTLAELAPDMDWEQFQILAWNRHGRVGVTRMSGSARDGGPFENLVIAVLLTAGDRVQRYEFFDVGDTDRALARFEELCADHTPIPPNAAARVRDRTGAAFAAGDWAALRALASEDFVYEDRTKRAQLSGNVELWIASMQQIASAGGRRSSQRIATIGERIVLDRLAWAGTFDEVRWEADQLRLTEVDADGRLRASINFDLDDRAAAFDEALTRFVTAEAAAIGGQAPILAFYRAFARQDWESLRASLADNLVFHDHRKLGLGVLGRDDWVESLRAQADLASDVEVDTLRILAWNGYGRTDVVRVFGTIRDGGPFENVLVRVILTNGDRIQRFECFDVGEADQALARFEELRPDPLRIPPNAASRARDRMFEAFAARTLAALRSLASHDMVWEDRSKRAMLTGDVELWIASLQAVSPRVRWERDLIATFGERVALDHIKWTGGPTGGEWDMEHITLTEVDADGRIRASISFEPEDRAAAFAEAHARFIAGEAAVVGGQASIHSFFRLFARRDWEAVRACLADNFVLCDHRTLGLGALGRDEWIASLRALHDLTAEWDGEVFRILAWNRHGRVDMHRTFGVLSGDGGRFENVLLRVIVTAGERIRHLEFFNVGDADQALARFEELCAETA